MKRFLVLLTAAIAALATNAQVTTSMASVDVGRASVLDTYMSPVTYTGVQLRAGYHNFKHNATGHCSHLWEAGVNYCSTQNPAGNHTTLGLIADARYSLLFGIEQRISPKMSLLVGPMLQFRGGVLYNSNNSNNVANAKVHGAAGVTATATFGTQLWHRPLTLGIQASLPVAGAFFSPDYDEAYYEIAVGNHSGLAHFGWWGNRFDLDNLIYADYRIGAHTTVRLGYRAHIESSNVCHIKNRIFTHALSLGIGAQFTSK